MDSAHSSSHFESHYAHHQSQPAGQQQQWPAPPHLPHLLQPAHTSSPYSSPATPSSQLAEQQYNVNGYFHHTQPPLPDGTGLERTSSSLSLNLSSLSVTSPTNLSPINNPSSHASSASTLSPITPLSPTSANTTPQQHAFPPHHNPAQHAHGHPQSHRHVPTFAYAPADHAAGGVRYDHGHYDTQYEITGTGGGAAGGGGGRRPTTSSRSSSSSEKSVPRKRSFTSATPLAVSMEEHLYENGSAPMDLSTPASYDEVDMGYAGMDSQGSPVDGSSSSGEHDDQFKPLDSHMSSSAGNMPGMPHGSVNILGKATGTNNFVTKLYQMINDPKSAHFISWTELGTSFVVSNVGEFSRSILGSHFKHNNFSSFVRQLNMYGFHKINRIQGGRQTPRAQRTSTDAQTWEFSHHKFLRGRPDLLDEIKRKALEPDPSIKHRVELPGEVAAQLNQMREQNRRVVKALDAERAKVERLTSVTKTVFDFLSKVYPGSLPSFPADLLDTVENPPIFVTSPSAPHPHASHFGGPSSMTLGNPSLHSLHSLSPTSSPTATDFPSHPHSHSHSQSHSLSRPHSLQHIPYEHVYGHGHGVSTARYETALSTPLPPSPGPMDALTAPDGSHGPTSGADQGRAKRQRTAPTPPSSATGEHAHSHAQTGTGAGGNSTGKRLARARSDSAPLGYGLGQPWGHGGRPRSGSGLAPVRSARRDDGLLVGGIGLGIGIGIGSVGSGSRGSALGGAPGAGGVSAAAPVVDGGVGGGNANGSPAKTPPAQQQQ
ncbi:hypothetical protein BD410DRAFT_882301 [Rickenella mellea]|uniref:HSF-type DNA-binding domain-containing protein n=1 Tax=Rickenella mellea TaxID=50990 RepID=A0A4Y7QIJ7_9AGAM|nr:hypothetical protein BD410DRAFT_882301 [Rickenella mellea]